MALWMETTKEEIDTYRTYAMEEVIVGWGQDFSQTVLQVSKKWQRLWTFFFKRDKDIIKI